MAQHTFTTYLDDDTPMRVQYHHSPAEPMTLECPGRDAEITLETVAIGFGAPFECISQFPQLNVEALTEKAWGDYELRQELNSRERV